ncbi:ead/Ea22-like family protein [Enterobacter hormaechei]|uniref:ead/Ea22-like family protein n=1 Tax=Enterobacter hormaechei TaxID=158836 RepID=UPI000AEE133D|nr:ead/Ea22-like family protein [Enterobacter hormaechei]
MSNVDKRALREAAEKAISEEGETWWSEEQLASDYGLALHKADAKFIAAANPATVLTLLDELEAAEKRIAELEAREVKLPQRFDVQTYSCSEEPDGEWYARDDVLAALANAGVRASEEEGEHG